MFANSPKALVGLIAVTNCGSGDGGVIFESPVVRVGAESCPMQIFVVPVLTFCPATSPNAVFQP